MRTLISPNEITKIAKKTLTQAQQLDIIQTLKGSHNYSLQKALTETDEQAY